MGLSIHYSGQIKSCELIGALIAEVKDICESVDWSCHPLTNDIKGICFSPPGCEPIFLTFLANGRMCSPINLQYQDIYEKNGLDPELMYTTSTKTQYAGIEAHKAIIKLLRYLKDKYFSVFELNDEGMYWETNDEQVLQSQFARYEAALNVLADALNEMNTVPGESAGSLADRIEQAIKRKFDQP